MTVGDDFSSASAPILLRSVQTMNFTLVRIVMPSVGVVVLLGAQSFGQSQDTAKALQTATTGSGPARYAAIDDLGETHHGASQVVPQLQKLLADSDPQVRWRSARAIGDFGDLAAAAAPDLRKLLADKDPVVQYHAAVAVGKIGDRSDETVRALVAATTGQDARVARAAIAALRELKPDPKHVAEVFEKALESSDQAVTLHAMEAIV